ncbi:hypothetical protein [Azospirillum melinis]
MCAGQRSGGTPDACSCGSLSNRRFPMLLCDDHSCGNPPICCRLSVPFARRGGHGSDRCSVRAKRGGDLTGPNPTDSDSSGPSTTWSSPRTPPPLAVLPSPANAHDSKLYADEATTAAAITGSVYATGFSRTSARLASPTAGLPARSDASSSTDALGCSQTNARIDDRIGRGASSLRCSPSPPSSLTPSVHSENSPQEGHFDGSRMEACLHFERAHSAGQRRA